MCLLLSKRLYDGEELLIVKAIRLIAEEMEAMQNMATQPTEVGLSQFIHCCCWMKKCLPNFLKMLDKLISLLEIAHAKAGKRKKSTLQHKALQNISSGTVQDNGFKI